MTPSIPQYDKHHLTWVPFKYLSQPGRSIGINVVRYENAWRIALCFWIGQLVWLFPHSQRST
jgi:hypothetical protein